VAICVYGIFVVLNTRDEMESIFLLTVSCQLRGVRGAHLRDDEDPKEHQFGQGPEGDKVATPGHRKQ